MAYINGVWNKKTYVTGNYLLLKFTYTNQITSHSFLQLNNNWYQTTAEELEATCNLFSISA